MTIQIALGIQAAAIIIVYGERGGPIGCLEKKGRADAITDGIPPEKLPGAAYLSGG